MIQVGTRVRWTMSDRLHCGIVRALDVGGSGFFEVEVEHVLYCVTSELIEVCPATPPFTCEHSVVSGDPCVKCAAANGVPVAVHAGAVVGDGKKP